MLSGYMFIASVIQVSVAAILTFERTSIQITPDNIDPRFICKKGECKICVDASKKDKVCVVAKDMGGNIHLKITWNNKSVLEGDMKGPSQGPICRKSPGIPNVEEICLMPKEVDLAKLHACLDVSAKVQGKTYREAIGCFTIPKKYSPEFKADEEDSPIIDISETDSLDDSHEGFNDDIDDSAESVNSEAGTPDDSAESVNGDIDGRTICHKGICKICRTFKRRKACVIARTVHGAMEVKLLSSRHVIVKGKITNNTDVSFCVHHVKLHPDIKSVCIVARNISVGNMSACVNVTVQAKNKTFNEALGCFKIPTSTDALQTLDFLEDFGAATASFDSNNSEDIGDATTSFDSEDSEEDDVDTVSLEMSDFNPFEADDNDDKPNVLWKAMMTFLKGLQEQTEM